HEQGLSLRRGTRAAGRRHRGRSQPVPPLCRFARWADGTCTARWRRSGGSSGISRDAPSRRALRLPYLLGAARLRRRLLPRGFYSLRRYLRRQFALLRLDTRLERPLLADLRRDRSPESVVLRTLQRKLNPRRKQRSLRI